MSEILLSAVNIKKIYKAGRKSIGAVNGISIDVMKGESVAVVGPSGAGKSTFLHMVGGLDRPTSGKVKIGGVDIYSLSDKERAGMRNRRIGFVFQSYHLLPEFTALENVMLPAMIKGTNDRDKALEVLKSVGLGDRANHRPSELSGGESQRVAIARALINSPELLLCDEPTGNLDSETSVSIYELLFGIKSRTGMSLVIVTHDDRMSNKTDHTVLIRDGKVI